MAILGTLRDSSLNSPTQVLKFDPAASKDGRVSEIYINDGAEISAGTVAAPSGDQFVVGSLTDHKLLLCKPEKPEKET
jgi:hypothetical protein